MADWVEYFKKGKRTIFQQCIGNRRLLELISERTPQGGHVLEAGCGTALLSMILVDMGFKVTALDFAEDILNYARSRFVVRDENMTFVRGDILKLTSIFPEKSFDTVCHSGVMEHFSDEDIVTSLNEQRRVSRRVVFCIPNDRNRLSPGHFGDERFMSNRKWIELIRKAGFHHCEVFGGYDVPKLFYVFMPGLFFHRKFSFWWRWASSHSIFVCE